MAKRKILIRYFFATLTQSTSRPFVTLNTYHPAGKFRTVHS